MNDWTVRYQNRTYQVLKKSRPLPRPRAKVVVRTLLDGRIELLCRGKKLKFEPVAVLRGAALERSKRKSFEHRPSDKDRTPSASHPWRRNYKLMWGGAGGR